MKKSEEPRKQNSQKQDLKKSKPKKKSQNRRNPQNHELAVVTYLFVGLFTLLIGYFIYFNAVLSPDVINNPYNSRQDTFADRIVRGNILASDGTVLARTDINSDGTETRSYPFDNMFAHVVGYSTRGKTGIESLANFNLLTSNAFIGERIVNEIKEEKNFGDNVTTTLDVDLQRTAYDALSGQKGAVVVLEVKTGKILAMVSRPDFNPNRINEDWEALNSETDSDSVLYNRASQGQYAPGSTFKIITLLEYIRENSKYEDFDFDCKGSLTEGNYTINCYGKTVHGQEDLKKSFAKSCNGAFASIGLSLDTTKFNETCQQLLFNTELPFSIPYSKSSFTLNESTVPAERMMTGIGQGETLVSPLHMAMIVSSIANEGLLMEPYLLEHVESYTGENIKTFTPSVYGNLMTEEEASILTEYMEEVVESGTGRKLNDLGFLVAGKTGTAEYSSDKSKSHAWFAGFSNTGEEDIAVCVLVEEVGSGSEYAVPIARKVFAAWDAKR